MQSGGGAQQGGGGHGRNMVAGPPSSSASPSSSSSAVSTSQLGLDQMQQRQSLQQQLLRNPEGREALLAYHSGNSGSPLMQLHRMARDQGQNRGQGQGQGFDQTMMNPVQQAYMQYAFQAQQAQQKSAHGMQPQQQIKMGTAGPSSDQDPRMGNTKFPDIISFQAANESKKQAEEGRQQAGSGQSQSQSQNQSQSQRPFGLPSSAGQMTRPMQAQQAQPSMHNAMNSQLALASQMQAMQALALERNIDLSLPQNANLVAQLIPLMQSRILGQQRAHESNVGPHVKKETSPQGNSSSELTGPSGSTRPRLTGPPNHLGSTSNTSLVNNLTASQGQQPSWQSTMHLQQSSMNPNQGADHSLLGESPLPGPEKAQAQKGHPAFTKQQLHVLKAQILAFRRLKKGERTLPHELVQAITPPPLETQLTVKSQPVDQTKHSEPNDKDLQTVALTGGSNHLKRESYEENATVSSTTAATAVPKETPPVLPAKEEPVNVPVQAKREHEAEQGVQRTSEGAVDKGKTVISEPAAVLDTVQGKRPSAQAGNPPPTNDPGPSRKYHGPLFDFPFFTRKHDAFGSSTNSSGSSNNNLTLAYDVRELAADGGAAAEERRNRNAKRIGGLLAVNLERRRIKPDLVLRLRIEEKKLRLLDVQARVREEVDRRQREIMAMPERPYRKFVRLCGRQRAELGRQAAAARRAARVRQLKAVFQWRKRLLEAHWAARDARTSRNRGVARCHERMSREFSKRNDEDRNKRMEALKNNDVERYREILLEQRTSGPGEAAERYEVLSSFLSQTEDYLHKLGGKITAAKNHQEVEEAANAASAAARAQGLSEEEVRAAASCAGEEVMIRNRFSEMNAPQEGSSVSKYYTLAHAVNERVLRQPSMLRVGTLRDYQLVGLQWMLSLYNNKLNGILADEMGLGKTVQVMALIAYLMEYKSNYGPHLIIVPNAVMVNWKSELHSWLPNVSCIYYVGHKDQRAKLFSQEVCAMKFNVLVTTYEFIMYDRAKLSRVDWKYIIIDEAQRMKDRESVLARDLDKYRCQRRLLLTGTPLQNDLKELWSLLNLLLPEVFDNRKAFHDWFSKPFQKEVSHNAEDDWLETEKKVIVIHRLHQILEPFMLRRRVEDVEGSLPPKISVILRCKMSAIQGSIYDWIKSTGTIRVDPEDEKRKVQKSSTYQAKTFKPLNNRCTELRKTCNHPLLNYPYFNDFSKDFLVRSCGKLWVLDRILIKLHRTGHRVLLFSTMTKLLDILEEYLRWRRLVYRRIDGTTSLEDRESAIVDFNRPETDCFIFLLSIRAAGRGLNLQTADTVVIYDPDPNPKNEEQAVARAHRIGQTREVKVIYLEAVVDKVPSHEKEDNHRTGGGAAGSDSDDGDLAGKDRYMGSIESLIRNNIQQYKIEMADEVINAGRFDQRTTHEERRSTLETLLRDEDRYQETVHDVPSLQQVNRMIARSESEVEMFDRMDEEAEFDWVEETTRYDQVPKWLRVGTREVAAAAARMSKKSSKNILYTDNIGVEPNELAKGRRLVKGKKFPNYAELDDDIEEFSEATSEEEVEDDRTAAEEVRYGRKLPETGSSGSGSSSGSRRLAPVATPSISSRKFGSLSALEAKPGSGSNRLRDDVEEGEVVFSGDSRVDVQQSGGSWNHEGGGGDDEQVLQPKIRRKRSIRVRPRPAADRPDDKSARRDPPPPARHKPPAKTNSEPKPAAGDSPKSTRNTDTSPARRNPNKANVNAAVKPTRANPVSVSPKDANSDAKKTVAGGTEISEAIQRRCKNVITKIQRRIDKEGQQIIPLLTDLWKRTESQGDGFLDLRKIESRVERFEYDGVPELIADVQAMLKAGMQYFGFSHEVRSEARKVHDLFFDILKIAFPDTDFREARSALTFSGSAAGSSPRVPPPLGPPKRQKPTLEVDHEPTPRPPSRGSVPTATRFGNNGTRDADGPRPLTHPGELVICKKKRKDRLVKPAGPVSPAGVGRRAPSPGQTRSSQSQSQPGGGIGWANPVKRMRTDAGKRRPSHL